MFENGVETVHLDAPELGLRAGGRDGVPVEAGGGAGWWVNVGSAPALVWQRQSRARISG